jgi:hypothetical protein
MLQRARDWQAETGIAPARTDWHPSRARRELPAEEAERRIARYQPGSGLWPSANQVMREFRSWGEFIREAALEKRPTLRAPVWPEERVDALLAEHERRTGRPATRRELDNDPALPSYPTVRRARLSGSE